MPRRTRDDDYDDDERPDYGKKIYRLLTSLGVAAAILFVLWWLGLLPLFFGR
jgi:hypothetical protein